MKANAILYKRRPRLTERQNEVLDFICESIAKLGIPPTRQEICDHFDFQSVNAAQCHIKALAAKGYIAVLHQNESGGRAGRFARGIMVL